jgi:hypothetical protein
MKKIVFLFLLNSLSAFSQTNNTPKFWDNVRYGGGFGFGFGNHNTTLAIAPSAIYVFDDQFAVGPSVSYLYNKNYDLTSNVYGVGIIGLYNPVDFLQLSAEYEHSFVTQKLGIYKGHFDFPALYLGLAYRSGWFGAGLRYDVLYDSSDTIYASALSPIVRFYF